MLNNQNNYFKQWIDCQIDFLLLFLVFIPLNQIYTYTYLLTSCSTSYQKRLVILAVLWWVILYVCDVVINTKYYQWI